MRIAPGRTAHDAIVVGAGVIGAACAAALAADGRRVLVLEAAFPGGGTTGAGMGHLVVMDDTDEELALTAYSTRLWAAQPAEFQRAVEADWCGTIWVAEDDEQLADARERQRRYTAHGVRAELLDSHGVAEAEPNLRRGLAGGLLVGGDGIVYPPAAARALLERARAAGATVRTGCTADAIAAHGVRCGAETLGAEVVVNAAGAAAPRLSPELPIVPRKGHLAVTDRYPAFCRHQVAELGYYASAHEMSGESVAFNVQPRRTGQLLIGSSRELVGWDATINRRVLGRMVARACEFLPALGELTVIRCWTGFRPATPDARPLIGALSETPGVWAAAGHEGLGIATALGTAALLSDLIAGRPTAIDPAPYAPTRELARGTRQVHR